jgi:lysophospholipase L1-like esterase
MARPSAAKRLAFSLVAVAIFLGLLEAVARIARLGDPEAFGGSRLRYTQVYPPLFRPTQDGSGYRPRDPRLPDRFVPRGPDVARVFVFGESAVAGLGYSENASFSRALERRLRARGPGATVVNCGFIGFNSRQILRVVRDVATLRARESAQAGKDVFVFHVGNNEFIESIAEKILERRGVPFAETLDRALEHSRLYLAMKQISVAARHRELPPGTFSTKDLRTQEGEGDARAEVEAVELSPAEVDAIVARHAERLRAMVEVARKAGAVPVLATVATNLEWPGKKDLFERAQARRAQGDVAGARADFTAARDQDPKLRRTLSVMNENVRRLAKELDVPLADGEQAIGRASDRGITGFSSFFDNVHFTPLGDERVAEEIDRALVEAKLAAEWKDGGEWVSRRAAALAAAPRDALDVREWIGWNGDKAFLADKNLWKLEQEREALEKTIGDGTATPEELVWAANGWALTVGGEPRARELYARAKTAKPDLAAAVDANVAWLDARPK